MADAIEIIIDDLDIGGDTVARVTAKANAVLIPDYKRNFPTTISVDEISFRVAADLFGSYVWTTAPTITDNRVGTGYYSQGPNTTALWHVLAAPLVEEISGNTPVSATGSLVEDSDGIAWDMDGVTEEVDWDTDQTYLSGVGTDLTIRVKCKSDTDVNNGNMLAKGQNIPSDANDSFTIATGNSQRWRARQAVSTGTSTVQSTPIDIGVLAEVAYAFEGGHGTKKQRLYLDGVQKATANVGDGTAVHNTAVKKLYWGAAEGTNNWVGQLYAIIFDLEIIAGYEAV